MKSFMDFDVDGYNKMGDRVEDIKEFYRATEQFIIETIPASRRRSEAITHLETSCMFAVKALVQGE